MNDVSVVDLIAIMPIVVGIALWIFLPPGGPAQDPGGLKISDSNAS